MRYYISRLRAKAFKSIGSSWLEVTLDKGLVAIVGPNGSGKSNLLDALAFVSACQPSQLRVQRLSDLQSTDAKEVCLSCGSKCSLEHKAQPGVMQLPVSSFSSSQNGA